MKYLQDISDKNFGLYACDNTGLQEAFIRLRNGERFVFSWKALLFGPAWLAYNRLYKETVMFACLLLVSLLTPSPETSVVILGQVSAIVIGCLGKRWLVSNSVKDVYKINSIVKDKTVLEKTLTSKVKTSKLAVVILIIAMIILIAITIPV